MLWEDIDTKKWLLDNFTFFEEIFEGEDQYYLEFCLHEEACAFVRLCCRHNIPFAYFPPYEIVIMIGYLKSLIDKVEYEREINQKMFPETHPLLKLH